MKKRINIIFIVCFCVLLIIPGALFNHEKNAVSEIDNKVLMENPLTSETESVDDLADALDQYVSERIGLRDQMISFYTLANDKLFGEMVHPIYNYGKDGYIFSELYAVKEYGEYEAAYVYMLTEMQEYCDERGISFVYVFDPSKISILRDKLPDGYNYNNDWVQEFLDKLDENDICYVDNTVQMNKCVEEGIQVFNVKYNAGHWNDTGAFYGMNAVLMKLQEQIPTVHVNNLKEYKVTQKLNTSLQVSQFPIYEYEPIYELKDSAYIKDITGKYDGEIKRNKSYSAFSYVINYKRKKESAPKALVFQGSYLNGMGYKFLQNAFGEYISVHDYQNVLNFEYYVDIFEPDCIVFEAAEYTFSSTYFDYEGMKNFSLNPSYGSFDKCTVKRVARNLSVTKGDQIIQIKVPIIDDCEYAYMLVGNKVLDMYVSDDGENWEINITKNNFNLSDTRIIQVDEDNMVKYNVNF